MSAPPGGAALSAGTQVVRFEHVGLRYGLGPEVLRDVSFRLEPHSFQFLTGPSGAGKTSLLRLLFLSLRPTRGLITLFGHDIALLSRDALSTLRRRIGIVFQDFRLLDHMTTYENVALPFRVIGREEDTFRDEVVELLHWVGLGERMWALPPVLSGGDRAAAAAARRRADRQCRSQPGAAPAAAVRRAQQIRHLGGDRDPRYCVDGPVRRAPPGAARGSSSCL
jgi:ABC-type ATPase involved in cell division